jgi:hypothetical protein
MFENMPLKTNLEIPVEATDRAVSKRELTKKK